MDVRTLALVIHFFPRRYIIDWSIAVYFLASSASFPEGKVFPLEDARDKRRETASAATAARG